MVGAQSRDLPSNLPKDVSLEQFLNCDSANAVPATKAEREAEQ